MSKIEIEGPGIVTVHLGDESITFENGHPIDGPEVLHDDTGPIAGCELCGWAHGFKEGDVGEVLARQAAMLHRCDPIRRAMATLTVAHANDER